jgi:hypothetical protein
MRKALGRLTTMLLAALAATGSACAPFDDRGATSSSSSPHDVGIGTAPSPPLCHDVVNVGPDVTDEHLRSPTPEVPQGGLIPDGVYVLTASRVYNFPGEAGTQHATAVVRGDRVDFVLGYDPGTDWIRWTSALEYHGTRLMWRTLCSNQEDAEGVSFDDFTVTSSGFRLLDGEAYYFADGRFSSPPEWTVTEYSRN